MGSPLGNGAAPRRTTSGVPADPAAASDGGGGNRVGRRHGGRPTQPLGHLGQQDRSTLPATASSNNVRAMPADRSGVPVGDEEKGTVDVGGVTAFLQAFQSIEALEKVFPELAAVTLSADVDAADLDHALGKILGTDRYGRLRRTCGPEGILLGLRELAARRRAAETASAPRPDKAAEQEEGGTAEPKASEAARPKVNDAAEQTREAKRGTARPRGSTVPGCLRNREIGARPRPGRSTDLAKQLALVRDDTFAAIGILMGHDVRKLARRYEETGRRVEALRAERPELWKAVERRFGKVAETNLLAIRPTHASYLFMEVTENVFRSETRFWKFFSALLSLESTSRYLGMMADDLEAVGQDASSVDTGTFEVRQSATLEQIAGTVAHEMVRSLLLTEKASAGFKDKGDFEKMVIESFIGLYETGDVSRAERKIRSRARSIWPDLPMRDDAGSDHDTDAVRMARKAAATTDKTIDLPPLTAQLHREIIYYYYIANEYLNFKPSDYQSWVTLSDISAFIKFLLDFVSPSAGR